MHSDPSKSTPFIILGLTGVSVIFTARLGPDVCSQVVVPWSILLNPAIFPVCHGA